MPAAVDQVQRENVKEVTSSLSSAHQHIISFAQVLAPLAILLIILKIFPILSWIILTSIGVHLLLARLQGLAVPKEVIFLELVLGFLAALPHGLFQKPLFLLFVLCSLLCFGVCALLQQPRSSQRSEEHQGQTLKPKAKEEEESSLKKRRRNVEEEQLAMQSKQLEALAKKENGDFVEELLKTFPPVHLPAAKWDKLDVKEETKMESLLRKVISIYHPDKVDRVKNGENYYLLCQMITAQLNVKYSKYK